MHFYDVDPQKPFTQWTQYMLQAAQLAQGAAKANYHSFPRRTCAVGTYVTPFPELVLIQPHAQKAFDLLVAHVENNASLPPSQCIPNGGTISSSPSEPGNCTQLLAPQADRTMP